MEFHIGDAEFLCGGRVVEDPFEQKLAWFLFLYGDWNAGEPEAKIDDGNLQWIQFVASKDRVEGQHFAMLGFLSQMTSLQFNELTTEEGKFVRLSPSFDPDELGIVIPADFRGEDLRLWRFTMSPNYE